MMHPSVKVGRPTRPQRVAARIKEWIVEQRLKPGDRLPGEPEVVRQLGHAKGTIREAFRILETEGLIRSRTGPGGGVFVHAVSEARAQALLANYFYFENLSIADIYQLRLILEPELVADLAGRLADEDIERLREVMTGAAEPATTAEEERERHIASLEFHMMLAELSGNALLGFVVRFLANVLREMTVYRRLFEPINPELRETGRAYQARVLEALEAGDAKAAREIMTRHMKTAWRMMEDQQAVIERRFISEKQVLAK